MSKRRNQVLFTKPEDPKFLKLIKQQAGYTDDGPNVDSKRAKFDEGDFSGSDDGHSDNDDEKPQVVVVRSGDLTADEAERERQRLEIENDTKPADLSERIVFKAKKGKSTPPIAGDSGKSSTGAQPKATAASPSSAASARKSHTTAKAAQSKLSFAFDDDDDEDEDEEAD